MFAPFKSNHVTFSIFRLSPFVDELLLLQRLLMAIKAWKLKGWFGRVIFQKKERKTLKLRNGFSQSGREMFKVNLRS